MYKLKIITSTTRPGRKGPILAQWALDIAKEHADFDTELVDIATIGLPLMDEAEHPRLKKYQHEHTMRWSRIIEEADAFVFVTGEYNFSFPAPLKNAIDYLFHEWGYKPVAFLSYGGQSGGLRSVQMLKQVVTTLKMMPVVESVAIPFFTKYINDQDKFVADDTMTKSTHGMYKELLKWTASLKPMRLQS